MMDIFMKVAELFFLNYFFNLTARFKTLTYYYLTKIDGAFFNIGVLTCI